MTKKKTKKHKVYKTYFVAESDRTIHTVESKFFDCLSDRKEALIVGVNSYLEFYRTLQADAIEEDELYIGPMKVINGLSRTLNELEHRWPGVNIEIRLVGNRYDNQCISVC